jgi:hypothetical protein
LIWDIVVGRFPADSPQARWKKQCESENRNRITEKFLCRVGRRLKVDAKSRLKLICHVSFSVLESDASLICFDLRASDCVSVPCELVIEKRNGQSRFGHGVAGQVHGIRSNFVLVMPK